MLAYIDRVQLKYPSQKLQDTWAYFTLYPGGTSSLMTGTSTPSCILLENRLYISMNVVRAGSLD